jgi:hypothetical protein
MLLDSEVAVVGAASMGALRAAELQACGMLGIGKIWQAFFTGEIDADDEVAILHTPDGQVLTEALVNLRCAIRGTAAAEQVTADEATALEEVARLLPYTRRTWTALHRAAAAAGLADAIERSTSGDRPTRTTSSETMPNMRCAESPAVNSPATGSARIPGAGSHGGPAS